MIPERLRHVRRIALEGGGMHCHAYGSVLERIEAMGLSIREYAGTSGGAIVAMLLALGRTGEQIAQIQRETPWGEWARYRPPALLRLLMTGGWHSIEPARRWIRKQIIEANYPPDVSFRDLSLAGRDLHVVATRYEQRGDGIAATPWVFGPRTTPHVEVAEAVLASMAVPVFWPPVEVDGWSCADGGVAMNHPIEVYADYLPEQILGLRVDTAAELAWGRGLVDAGRVRPSLRQLAGALFKLLHGEANRAHVPDELWPRIIQINTGSIPALDFDLPTSSIDALRAAGGRALDAWIGEDL